MKNVLHILIGTVVLSLIYMILFWVGMEFAPDLLVNWTDSDFDVYVRVPFIAGIGIAILSGILFGLLVTANLIGRFLMREKP